MGDLEIENVRDDDNRDLVGLSVGDLAAERDTSKLETFLDLALLEDLQMSFRTRSPEIAKQFIAHIVETSLKDPIVMAGQSWFDATPRGPCSSDP